MIKKELQHKNLRTWVFESEGLGSTHTAKQAVAEATDASYRDLRARAIRDYFNDLVVVVEVR